MSIFSVIGIVGGLLYIIGDIPYIRDTIKGKTKPHRVSWLIFLILDLIFLANQYALGARNSLYIYISWALITLTVFILSIKKGVGGASTLDISLLIGAVFSILLWRTFDSPLASLFFTMLVSFIGFIPTFIKSYRKPKSETRISWLIATIAIVLGAISVGKLDFRLLVLPIYNSLMTFSIFTILTLRSRSKKARS